MSLIVRGGCRGFVANPLFHFLSPLWAISLNSSLHTRLQAHPRQPITSPIHRTLATISCETPGSHECLPHIVDFEVPWARTIVLEIDDVYTVSSLRRVFSLVSWPPRQGSWASSSASRRRHRTQEQDPTPFCRATDMLHVDERLTGLSGKHLLTTSAIGPRHADVRMYSHSPLLWHSGIPLVSAAGWSAEDRHYRGAGAL